MVKKSIMFLCILVVCCGNAYALEISSASTYQNLDLTGKVKVDGGTEINVENDLGLDNDQPMGGNLRIDTPRNHILLEFASAEFSETKTLTNDIAFRQRIYYTGTSVESKVAFNQFDLQYFFDLFRFNKEKWNLKLAISPLVKVTTYDAEISLKNNINDESYSAVIPIPTAGLHCQLDFTKYLSLFGQVSGISSSSDARKRKYYEYKGTLRIKPIKYVYVDVGYVYNFLDFSIKDSTVDLNTKGLYVAGGLAYKF